MTPRALLLKMICTAVPDPVNTSIRLLPSKVNAAPGDARPSCLTSPSTVTLKKVRSKTTTVISTADDVVATGVSFDEVWAASTVDVAPPSSSKLAGTLSSEVGLATGEASSTSEMDGPWVGPL